MITREMAPFADDSLAEAVIQEEWSQFGQVQNEGGRASCQDNWHTFHIMRKAQFSAWDTPSLESYRQDLIAARSRGWNLIAEKYARMMASTCPEEYRRLKDRLPPLAPERLPIQEELVQIHVVWMEEFSRACPLMAGQGRPLRSVQDTPWDTSYETYFRGEISTWSLDTLQLYSSHVRAALQAGVNLVSRIMDVTAALYGYRDARDAEAQMSRPQPAH